MVRYTMNGDITAFNVDYFEFVGDVANITADLSKLVVDSK
jgi:hypothetical protein